MQVEAAQKEAQRINKYQALFKLNESSCDDLGDTSDEVNLKLSLWLGTAEFETLTETWTSTVFEQLDVAGMEEIVTRFHKSVFKMERGLPPNKLVPKLRNAVDEFKDLMPVIAALRNRALKERHWTKIFDIIGTQFTRDATFTLQVRARSGAHGRMDGVWCVGICSCITSQYQDRGLVDTCCCSDGD